MKNVANIHRSVFKTVFALVMLLSGLSYAQAQTGQRFKRIDYGYDQISGKVNEVHYQAGEADAFYHVYQYDADNRITKVNTSKDSIIWDEDARYFYYEHGPLARVEIGDNNVQGMDYAYTLQGWIKGVNSNLLKAENDMGQDGLPNGPHPLVAKDAFGYTLNYHTSDYQAIDNTNWNNTAQRFEAVTANSDLMAARFDLFNGNIGSMVTTLMEPKVYTGAPNEMPNILPQGTAYKYDQLNRLLEMKAFQNLKVSTNEWEQGSTYNGLYHNAFKYDANGNILGQLRADGAGTIIDSLTYKYAKHTNQRTKANRLYLVNDQVSVSAFTDDIDDQGAFDNLDPNDGSNNYMYDSIGNLIQDRQEEIKKIEWTIYGKIKSITRFLGSLRSDLEFHYDAGGNRVSKIEKPRDVNGVKPQSDWIATYYGRDAHGNVMGIYRHVAVATVVSCKVMERNIYGGSRLGSDYTEVELVGTSVTKSISRTLGNKWFEGSNHLGNVLAVFGGRKIPRDDGGDGVVDYFQPDVVSSSDYSPFGVILDGRGFGNSGRFGFNSKEKDNEISGNGNNYDYGFRIYNPRLGRFLSIDPIASKFPFISPYIYAEDRPVDGKDLDGLEWTTTKTYDVATGRFEVHYEVKIKVYSSSECAKSAEEQKEIMEGVKSQFEASLTQFDKDKNINYTAELKYEFVDVKDIDKKKDFVMELGSQYIIPGVGTVNGITRGGLGESQVNDLMVSVDDLSGKKRELKDIIRTAIHELLHSGGERHPFDQKNEVEDVKQYTPAGNRNNAVEDKTIQENIMNSGGNPVKKLQSTEGTKLTSGQKVHLANTINKAKKRQ